MKCRLFSQANHCEGNLSECPSLKFSIMNNILLKREHAALILFDIYSVFQVITKVFGLEL